MVFVLAGVLMGAGCGEGSQIDKNEWLPGGDTTNRFLFGSNAFSRHADNITFEHELMFATGNSFFTSAWVQAPSSTTARDGVGPLFNARSCEGCHRSDGRGQPPDSDEEFLGLLIRLSTNGQGHHGAPEPDPNYGDQLQPFSILGVPAEANPELTYTEVSGMYEDGTTYTLLEPTYTIENLAYGPLSMNLRMSPRVAPQMIGLGLLEAISEERLEELEDPDDVDGDGVSGRINQVWDVENEAVVVGRFGWKAEQPTIKQQTAAAFLGDIGITTPLFTNNECTAVQTDCLAAPAGGDPEIDEDKFSKVVVYSSLLAPPGRLDYDDPVVLEGKNLFQKIGCDACHTPSHTTGESHLEELAHQLIYPYTDMLLHDMGAELSDSRPSFAASGEEWRTPPLWGIGYLEEVNGHTRLLHDGRARGVAEAILWHGGEAAASQNAFKKLSRNDRDALVRFVESL